MEEFYPSEIARLVLGYLKEAKCTASWQTFLDESADLQEHNRLFKEGKIYPTNVNGKSLLDILSEYCALKREAINNENKKNTCHSSDSEAIKTPNKVVHDAFTKFTLNQKIQTQSVSLSYGRGSPGRNDFYHRSPTSRPISRTPRRLYECQATPLNFGQAAENTGNESRNQNYRGAPSSHPRASFYKTPSKRDAATNENMCLSDPVVTSRPRIQDGVVQTDLVLSGGRTNVANGNIQLELNLPSSSAFSQSSSEAVPHCTNASQPEDHCGNNGFAAYSKSNVATHNTLTECKSVALNEPLSLQDPAGTDLVEMSPSVLNQRLVYRSSEITASDGNIIMTTMKSSVTPQYVSDPPPYNRAPNTNSPRIILSLDRSQISSLTTPRKEKKCWTEELCSPRRKGFIPRRRLLSESPAPKQCPETIPSFSTMHDDLAALEEFFSYQPLAEKIAENINKAKCNDELKETVGSNSYSALPDISGSEEIIKNVLARTEADPVFDEYLSMLCSTRDCSEANSLQEANFPKAGSVPSHREYEVSEADSNVEKHNQENKKNDDAIRVGNIESTDVSKLVQTKNNASSDKRCVVTEVISNSNPSCTDSSSINYEISSNAQKSSEIANNICTENSVGGANDKNYTGVPDGLNSSFSTNSNKVTSCSVGNENRNLNSTECNISAPENVPELNLDVRSSTDPVTLIRASTTTKVDDTEIKKNTEEKETSANNTETVESDICDDTLSKIVQISNITDSCSNHMPATQIQNEPASIFELPCPSVPTLLVPSFAPNSFPVQNNVQYRLILPAGFGTSGCETYLPLSAFQIADNVITNPGLVISPSKVPSNGGNLEAHPESIGNHISFSSKINKSRAPFNCSPGNSSTKVKTKKCRNSPSKVKTPKKCTQSYKRKKKNENEDSSKRKRDTDPKPSILRGKRKKPRFPKKKLCPLFASPKNANNKQVIAECVGDDIPVLSIPEPSPSNSDQQTAFEIFSKITNKLEVQSPVLKSLISSAKVLTKEGGRLNSTHVRCLDFDSSSFKQDKESGSEKKDMQNRRSERIKERKNTRVPEVKGFCSMVKKHLKINKHDTSPHKNKRKMASPRKVVQVNQSNSSTNTMTNAILSCMEEALQQAICGDKGTSKLTDSTEADSKSVLNINSSDQKNPSNAALDVLHDSDDSSIYIDNSPVRVMCRDEYFPEISNSPCALDTNPDTCVKDLPNSLKDTIHSKLSKCKSTDSIANVSVAKEKDVENKLNSAPNEMILENNSDHQKDTSKKNIPDVGKNLPHSKKKKKQKKCMKPDSVKHSEILASSETKQNLLTDVQNISIDHGKGIEKACNNTSIPKETDSLEVLCSKKQLLVSIVPVDANLDHETAVENENVNTLQKQGETKITMCQKEDLFVESSTSIQNSKENVLNEIKSASEREGIAELDSNNSVLKSNKSPREESILHKSLSLSAEKFRGSKSSPVSKQSHLLVDVSSDISASAGTENTYSKDISVENLLVNKKFSSDSDSHNSVDLSAEKACKNERSHSLGKEKYLGFSKDSNSIVNSDLCDDHVSNFSTQEDTYSSDVNTIKKKYAYLFKDEETEYFGKFTSTPKNVSLSSKKKSPACNVELKFIEKNGSKGKASSSSDSFEMPKDVAHSKPGKVKARENESTHVSVSHKKSPRSNFITSYFYPSSSISHPADSNDTASSLVKNNQTVDKLETNSFKNKPNKTHATLEIINTIETESDSIPKYSDVSALKACGNNGQITECSGVESKLSANVIVSESSNKSYKIDNSCLLSSKSVSFEKTSCQEMTLSSEALICEMEKSDTFAKSPSKFSSPTTTDDIVKSKSAQNIDAVSHTSNSVESRKNINPKIRSLAELALTVSPREKINNTSFKYNSKVSSPQKVIFSLESNVRSNSLTGQKDLNTKDTVPKAVAKNSPEQTLSVFHRSSDFKKKYASSQESVKLQNVVSSEEPKTSALNIPSKVNLKDALDSSYEAAEKSNRKNSDLLSNSSKLGKNKKTVNTVDLSIKNIDSLSGHYFETVDLLPEPVEKERRKSRRNFSPSKVTSPASEGQLPNDVQSVSRKASQNSLISPRRTLQFPNNRTSEFDLRDDSVETIVSPVKNLNSEATMNKMSSNSRSKVIESSSHETHNSNINNVSQKLNTDKSENNKLTDSSKSTSFNPVSKSVDLHNSSSCMYDISGNKYKSSSELPARSFQSLDSFPSENLNINKSLYIPPEFGHEEARGKRETFNQLQNCQSRIDLNVGKSNVKVNKVLFPDRSPSVTSKIALENRTLRCSSPGYNREISKKEKGGSDLLIPKAHPHSIQHLNSDDLTDTGSFVSGTLEIDEKWSESDKPSENDKNSSSDELIDNFEGDLESENLVSAVAELENAFTEKSVKGADECDALKNANLIKSPNKASLPKKSFRKENSKKNYLPSENEGSPVLNIIDDESSRTILYSLDRVIAHKKSNQAPLTSHYSGEKKHLSLPHSQSKIANQQAHKNNPLNKERYKHPETALKSSDKDKLRNVLKNNSDSSAAEESSSLSFKVLPPPKKRIRPVPIGSPSSQTFIAYTPFMSSNAMSNVQTASKNVDNANKKRSPMKVRTETVGADNSTRSKEKFNESIKSSFPNSVLDTDSNCMLKPTNLKDQSKNSPLKTITSFSESDSPVRQSVFKIPTFKSPSPKRIAFKQFSPNPVLPSGKPKAMSEIYRNAFPNKDLPISPISFSNSSCTGDAFLARRQLIDNESCSISPSKVSEKGILESCPENAEIVHNTPENVETGINAKKPAVVNDEKIVESPNNNLPKACSSKHFEDEERIDDTSGRVRKISESILSDTCSTIVDCSDLEIMTPEKCNDFYNDELFATTSSPICRRKRKLSKLCSSPECTPEKISKISVPSNNIDSLNTKCQLAGSPSFLTSNKILKSKTPTKNASQNFPHLLANLNPNSMSVVQKNINKDFTISLSNAKSPNKTLKSPPVIQYSQNSSVRRRIAHKSHVRDSFHKTTLSSSNVSSTAHEKSSISNKYSASISPSMKKSVKNISRSPQSSHNYRKSGQGPLKKSFEKFSVAGSKVNSKNYQDSPVRSISNSKRLINKTALSKKLEQDPCIPAGVKIPYKWNSKKIINYSDAIGQSSSYKNISKTNSSTGKRVRRSRPTIKVAALKSPVKMSHIHKNHNLHKSDFDVSTKFVENEDNITKETSDENKKWDSTSRSTNKSSDRTSKTGNRKKSIKAAAEDILPTKSINSNDAPMFSPEKAAKTYSRVCHEKKFTASSKQPANKFVDYENTRDIVESDIGRSNEKGSELANAIAFLANSLAVSDSEALQYTAEASEENVLESVCEPGSTLIPVTSSEAVPQNAKINLLLSKIQTIGLDSVLDLIKSREKD